MKVILCGSMSEFDKILAVRDELVKLGHEVTIPLKVEDEKKREEMRGELIRDYYEKMKVQDAVLIVNLNKRGIEGYIGGNSLLEMGFAHVLGKKLFCLNPLPEISYRTEMISFRPTILNGSLSNLK